jgi:predicted cobalt transporter CbtA
MSDKKSRVKDWILFVASTACMIYLLMFHAEWFWVMLPFVGLSAVRSLDVI